ncbi:STAS domain-containing protein [Streptomyces sp. NPDC059909]|uniref:STAS domain-containing protein n=1 Tax=Streptomyces sp. NPDC059909 TaxID=3346998 RepID=UPI00365E0B4F
MSRNSSRCLAVVVGEIDTTGAPTLRETLTAALRSGSGLDLDLGDAEFCDFSGLRVLEDLRSQAMAAGRRMNVLNATSHVRALLAANGLHDLLASGGPPHQEDAERPPASLLTRVRETLAAVGFQTSPTDTEGAPGLSIEEQPRGIAVTWAAPTGLHRRAGHHHEPGAAEFPGIDNALHTALVVALTTAGFLMDDSPDTHEVIVTGERPAPAGGHDRAAVQEHARKAIDGHATVNEAIEVVASTGRLTPGQGRHVLGDVSRDTGIPLLRLSELIVDWAGGGQISLELREQLERSLARQQPCTPPTPPDAA